MRKNRTTVTVELTGVQGSGWAANRLEAVGASPRVSEIDVTGEQTVTIRSGSSTVVSVQLGITAAFPPSTRFCTLDGVLPARLQDAFESK